jgi:RNA polymerase sigma-70 factor (ECF subfamily)
MESTRELFEEIYEAHGAAVKRFIFAQARRDADATDDIFQNTWLNVFRYMHTLRDRGSAKAWLYSIAKNEAARYYSRREARAPQEPTFSIDADDAPDIASDDADGFPDALADAEQVAKLLGRLPEAEQQLMLLHYGYEMGFAEIARLTGANYNTVKSTARRATAKLRKFAEALRDER